MAVPQMIPGTWSSDDYTELEKSFTFQFDTPYPNFQFAYFPHTMDLEQMPWFPADDLNNMDVAEFFQFFTGSFTIDIEREILSFEEIEFENYKVTFRDIVTGTGTYYHAAWMGEDWVQHIETINVPFDLIVSYDRVAYAVYDYVSDGPDLDNLFGFEEPYDMSVTVVPEPATLALLGLGAVGLLRKRK